MLVLPFSGLLKHLHGKSRDVGCARSLLCVWMHSCARGDVNPAKTRKNFVTFHGSQHCGERRGKCCLVTAASFPSETARQPPGSLLPSHEGIITINRLHSLPCSRDCCEVRCGWHRSICLASCRSIISAGRELPQSRHSPSEVRRCQSAYNFCSLCFKPDATNK